MSWSLLEAVFKAVLGKDLVAIGFSLKEDEDFAYLYQGSRLAATYNARTVTVERLREDARKELEIIRKQASPIRFHRE